MIQVKFGKTGSLVSVTILGVVLWGLVLFLLRLQDDFNVFPNLVTFIVLSVAGYFILKPCLLSYFVLSFSKDHQLNITRPFYKFDLFENAIRNYTLDLKEIEKVLVVIPERPSAPENYLFFMKGNTGIASLILYFDEKEGKIVKQKLKASKVTISQKNILDLKYDSMIGVSTLN